MIRMSTKASKNRNRSAVPRIDRVVLVGSTLRTAPVGVGVCRGVADLPGFLGESRKDGVFVTYRKRSTDDLLRACLTLGGGTRLGDLLTLEPPRPESVPALSGLFHRVVGAIAGYRWLPVAELPTVLSATGAADRFIGGAVDEISKTVALVRGDLSTVVAPFAFFKASGDGTEPDFSKLAVADHGLTVALGDYEASADGILHEFDPDYRKRIKKERMMSEQSFGASLRRLRLERGLKRSDFARVASKTIARIERGEVERPRGKTLATIAQRLGVDAHQIESF